MLRTVGTIKLHGRRTRFRSACASAAPTRERKREREAPRYVDDSGGISIDSHLRRHLSSARNAFAVIYKAPVGVSRVSRPPPLPSTFAWRNRWLTEEEEERYVWTYDWIWDLANSRASFRERGKRKLGEFLFISKRTSDDLISI